VSIAVTPASPSVAKGLPLQFTAVGTYTGGSKLTLTSVATWESSDMETATISNASTSQGRASAALVGSTSISATFKGVAGSTTMT
jgi:hypothetical protein